jgi:CheY-like chemotaxis protein
MAGRKILIIDADPTSRQYLANALRQGGYEILMASSGKEGLVTAWRDHPDAILADPVMPDLAGEELATRLRGDPRTSSAPLIALSSDPKPARRQSCMQAGFSDFIAKSPQLLPALGGSLARFLTREKPLTREGGLLFTFVSAKGGIGTSSLCANLATDMAQAHPQKSLVVADLVLPIGSLAGIVGHEGEPNLVSIARMPAIDTTPEFLRSSLLKLEAWHFRVLAGSPDPHHAAELNVDRIAEIVASLKLAFDFVVLDVGRSLARFSMELIQQSDLIAMIAGSDLTSIGLTKTVWDFLQANGVQPAAAFVVLNRAVGLQGMSRPEAEKILDLPIRAAMPYLSENMSLANNQHHPYAMNFPTDTATIILKDTAQQMVSLAQRLRAATT